MALDLGTVTARLEALTADFERDFRNAETTLNRFGKKYENFGRSMRAASIGMTAGLTLPITLLGGKAVKEFSSFDDAMTKSLAIFKGVSSQMRGEMSRLARQLSKDWNVAAAEVARGYYFLGSAGLSAEQSLKSLEATLKFAKAGAFDMAAATSLAADAQSAMGMRSSDAVKNAQELVRVTDVLTEAQNMANATTKQFSEALTNQAAPAFRMLGKDVEEATAVLAAMADQGQKGRRAGIRLAMALTAMQQGARKNADVWDDLNVKLYDDAGEMRNLADVIGDLENAFTGLSDEAAAAQMESMGFTIETSRTIQMLMGVSDRIREYEARLRQAAGTTEDVASYQMRSLAEQMGRVRKTFIDFLMTLAQDYEPQIRRAVGAARDLFDDLNALPREIRIGIVVAGAGLAAIGPLLGMFALAAIGASKLKVAIGVLKGALGSLTTSAAWIAIGKWAAVLATAYGAWQVLSVAVSEVIAAFQGMGQANSEVKKHGQLVDLIRDRWENIQFAVAIFREQVRFTMKSGQVVISNFLGNMIHNFMAAWERFPDIMSKAMEKLPVYLGGALAKAGFALKGKIDAWGAGIAQFVKWAKVSWNSIWDSKVTFPGLKALTAGVHDAMETVDKETTLKMQAIEEMTNAELAAIDAKWKDTFAGHKKFHWGSLTTGLDKVVDEHNEAQQKIVSDWLGVTGMFEGLGERASDAMKEPAAAAAATGDEIEKAGEKMREATATVTDAAGFWAQALQSAFESTKKETHEKTPSPDVEIAARSFELTQTAEAQKWMEGPAMPLGRTTVLPPSEFMPTGMTRNFEPGNEYARYQTLTEMAADRYREARRRADQDRITPMSPIGQGPARHYDPSKPIKVDDMKELKSSSQRAADLLSDILEAERGVFAS
jgi:TP901 family phage tail tape measure protein